jgi:putative oxidoreductase
MGYGILLVRVVLGLTMAGHGAQKLFGWWGGPGLRGTAGWLGSLRFRGPLATAALVGAAELGGGVLLALGLLTPLGSVAIASVMLAAIALVHWRNGFWNGNGGIEFNLLVLAVAVGLAATGGGRFSLDDAIGWVGRDSGLWWGVGALGVAVLGALAALTAGRRPEQPAGVRADDDRGLRAA